MKYNASFSIIYANRIQKFNQKVTPLSESWEIYKQII